MAISGRTLVDRMGALMSTGDVDALTGMYSSDAEVVLYHRVAVGREEIGEMLAISLASHGLYKVLSVDQFQNSGDTVMWDATVETDVGFLETTHIVILDDDGLIRRHIPRIRGYWACRAVPKPSPWGPAQQ